MDWRHGLRAVFACISLAGAGSAGAEPGVFADRIIFGQVAALEGPAAALGTGMRDGILAAFAEANGAGGIEGRTLELVSENDGYEPRAAIQATKRLVAGELTFALVGAVGTQTAAAAKPIAELNGVPFIGALSGADLLRTPFQRNVVNLRASYLQETELLVAHLTKDLGLDRVAILFQDDSFGRAGYEAALQALAKRGLQFVAEGSFERNTTAVRAALLAIRRGNPQAVIMIAPYPAAAEFVRLSRRLKFTPLLLAVSSVGADALAAELGTEGDGIVVTEVMPLPDDTASPLVARYRAALEKAVPGAKPGFASLEGYLVGRFVVEILKTLGPEPTQKAFLDAVFRTKDLDIDGLRIGFGADDNQGMDKVTLTAIQNGRLRSIDNLQEVAR
jgi:branched-chain amino acid transport system substrate-binding protein